MLRKTLHLTTILLSACVATDGEAPDAADVPAPAAIAAIRPALACSTYAVTELGLPTASGGGGASAIDDTGNVSGTYNPTSVAIGHAFKWTAAGGFVDLGTLGGSFSSAQGINGARVVGVSYNASGDGRAFLNDATGNHDLGTLGGGGIDGSEAYGVNASGVIVGQSRLANGFEHAAQFSATGAAIDLGTLVGTAMSNSRALAINGAIIVGASDTATGSHAARWSGESITDLGSIGTDDSVANAVNASGVAAGNILHSFVPRPAKFSGGTVTSIPIVTGFETANATGINSAGLIVGTMTHSNGSEVPSTQHGYIYDGTASTDLNTLITGSGWLVTSAVAINTSGAIAGTAVSTSTMMGADHRSHPVVIKPTCGTTKAFRAVATVTNGTTVARPAGTAAGDFLLAALEYDADPSAITPPTGWTLVKDQLAGAGASIYHAVVYSHVATGSEPASYTFAAPGGVYVDIQVAAYQGITAVDAVASTAATAGSIAAPSVTTTSAGEILVTIFQDFEGGTWSTASGMTLRTNFDSNSLQDQARPTAGATGTRTATDATGALAAISIALK